MGCGSNHDGRGPDELAASERILDTRRDDKLEDVGGMRVDAHVGGDDVQGETEAVELGAVGAVVSGASNGDEMIAFEHDRERWLGFAVLVAEHELGKERQLVCDRVNFPVVDIIFGHVVFHVVATVAEMERRGGVEVQGASDALHEGIDA